MRALLFFLPVTLLAQNPPDAKTLLTRADAPIFTAKTVRLSAKQASGFVGSEPVPSSVFTLEFVRGGRGRAEFHSGIGDALISLTVFDGTNLWQYHALGKQYTKKAAKAWTFKGEIATLEYGRNPANIAAASYENDETIDWGGRQMTCYVIRADYRAAPKNSLAKGVVRRVWISRDGELILRDYWEGALNGMPAREIVTTNYTTIEMDIPMPPDLFVFQPPVGSKLGEPILVGGVAGGVVGGLRPPPPPPRARPADQATTTGSAAVRPTLIHKVDPVYPQAASTNRVSGAVVLQATIDKDGTVKALTVMSGPSLLRPAAVDAVKQWRYKPTLVNGEPVEVVTMITIPFTLPLQR